MEIDSDLALEPLNDLEAALARCKKDQGQLGLFLMKLFSSQVIVLVRKEPQSATEPIEPLVIRGAGGAPALALFTSPERATRWAQQAAEYRHALLTDAAWVIRSIRPGCGAAINPGWALGLEIAPEGVLKVRRDFDPSHA